AGCVAISQLCRRARPRNAAASRVGWPLCFARRGATPGTLHAGTRFRLGRFDIARYASEHPKVVVGALEPRFLPERAPLTKPALTRTCLRHRSVVRAVNGCV